MITVDDFSGVSYDLAIGDSLASRLHGGATFRVARRPLNIWGDDSFCKFCALYPNRQGAVHSYADAILCGRVACESEQRADKTAVVLQYERDN